MAMKCFCGRPVTNFCFTCYVSQCSSCAITHKTHESYETKIALEHFREKLADPVNQEKINLDKHLVITELVKSVETEILKSQNDEIESLVASNDALKKELSQLVFNLQFVKACSKEKYEPMDFESFALFFEVIQKLNPALIAIEDQNVIIKCIQASINAHPEIKELFGRPLVLLLIMMKKTLALRTLLISLISYVIPCQESIGDPEIYDNYLNTAFLLLYNANETNIKFDPFVEYFFAILFHHPKNSDIVVNSLKYLSYCAPISTYSKTIEFNINLMYDFVILFPNDTEVLSSLFAFFDGLLVNSELVQTIGEKIITTMLSVQTSISSCQSNVASALLKYITVMEKCEIKVPSQIVQSASNLLERKCFHSDHKFTKVNNSKDDGVIRFPSYFCSHCRTAPRAKDEILACLPCSVFICANCLKPKKSDDKVKEILAKL